MHCRLQFKEHEARHCIEYSQPSQQCLSGLIRNSLSKMPEGLQEQTLGLAIGTNTMNKKVE